MSNSSEGSGWGTVILIGLGLYVVSKAFGCHDEGDEITEDEIGDAEVVDPVDYGIVQNIGPDEYLVTKRFGKYRKGKVITFEQYCDALGESVIVESDEMLSDEEIDAQSTRESDEYSLKWKREHGKICHVCDRTNTTLCPYCKNLYFCEDHKYRCFCYDND